MNIQRRLVWLLLGVVVGLGALSLALLLTGARLMIQPAPTSVQLPATPTVSTPSALPQVTATPTFEFGRMLLSDTFEHADHSILHASQGAGATYSFMDGSYAISVETAKYIAWSPLEGSYDDIAIQVDATLSEGPSETAAGIIFRYQDEENYYFFNITSDGYYSLALQRNGDWTAVVDWTAAPGLNRLGGTNRLRVEAAGERIRLYANGALLDEVSDPTFSSGRIALAVNTFDQGDATVRFDNLALEGK